MNRRKSYIERIEQRWYDLRRGRPMTREIQRRYHAMMCSSHGLSTCHFDWSNPEKIQKLWLVGMTGELDEHFDSSTALDAGGTIVLPGSVDVEELAAMESAICTAASAMLDRVVEELHGRVILVHGKLTSLDPGSYLLCRPRDRYLGFTTGRIFRGGAVKDGLVFDPACMTVDVMGVEAEHLRALGVELGRLLGVQYVLFFDALAHTGGLLQCAPAGDLEARD